MPCSEKRARLLLERGRARVHRVVPFVIRLTDRRAASSAFQPLRLKLDPGSKVTGLALVRETESVEADTGEVHRQAAVLNLFELLHRGAQISQTLTARSAMRRRRRGNLRYRAPRFLNRTRPKGWLAPSLQHRVDSALSWVRRIQRWAPLTALSCERVRFDMQRMENPEISGVEYQQGTLAGYEVREYLLEKWQRRCAYCGAENVPLEIEHVIPRSKGGSNRASNLTLACHDCNEPGSPHSGRKRNDPLKMRPPSMQHAGRWPRRSRKRICPSSTPRAVEPSSTASSSGSRRPTRLTQCALVSSQRCLAGYGPPCKSRARGAAATSARA